MARQTGIIGIQGTVGGLVFSKNGNISQKPASDKEAFANSPSRARARENAAEFGLAAKYSKLLRDSLRVAIASASDSQLAARLTKVMREVIGLDDTNDRGQRVFDSGEQDYYLDLVFYHLKLRCFVIIDLKMGDFKLEDSGNMNFYLSAADELLRHLTDQPTIGLVLCKSQNRVVAEYALRGLSQPIGVAEWQLTRALPAVVAPQPAHVGRVGCRAQEAGAAGAGSGACQA